MGHGGATIAASQGRITVTAVQNFYKVPGTCAAAFKPKVAEGEGDMIERRLCLDDPAAVLIVWVAGREPWRGDGIEGVGEDVAATGLLKLSSEAPALSGRARLKSHKEAASCRDDGVAQLLPSTHADQAGGCRA